MIWFAYAALLAGVLPLIFMSVGYFFLVRRRRKEQAKRKAPF